jgi:3',5'-cyclic AMP phosphodiesterase CpdA
MFPRPLSAAAASAALLLAAVPGIVFAQDAPAPSGPFLVKPYVQLGEGVADGKSSRLTLVWHTPDTDAGGAWSVEIRPNGDGAAWTAVKQTPAFTRVALPGVDAHRVYTAALTGLKPGATVPYRVLRGGSPVFEATAAAPRAKGSDYRFVVFGDCGAGTPSQRKVAYQTSLVKPDMVVITGDIVYSRGRISEYATKFWPVYNADAAAPDAGAPLLRSVPFVGAPGNHDILNRDFEKYPDALAYFLYWKQPLNGPLTQNGDPSTPTLSGPAPSQAAFVQAAGAAYPRMANFSYDYAGAHWLVLDSNPYVNWDDPKLRAWVEQDLAKAKDATWRFVAFHHPGFNSSKNHFGEQQMRAVADLFEKGKVDVVFNGHVHNYQRTYPMTFAAAPSAPVAAGASYARPIAGAFTFDKEFDGKAKTKPKSVIYLVTGAGGADLYNPEQQTDTASWQPFTVKYVADTHSLTVVDVKGKRRSTRTARNWTRS